MMKITVLVDNNENGNLNGEWGFSAVIDFNGRRFLLDAGASSLISENAGKIGLDLGSIDYAVLSHAHYDHSDGLKSFFEKNSSAKLFLQQCCECTKCYKKHRFYYEYIGIRKGLLKNYNDRLVYVDGNSDICDGVHIVSHSSADRQKIGLSEKMYVKSGLSFIPDDFSHEQSLVFECESGLVIFNSCTHTGPVNVINEVSSLFPEKKISAYIGGFHLFNKTDDAVISFAQLLKESSIEQIYTGHCTGNHAYEMLKSELGDKIHSFHAGLNVEIQ